MKDDRTILAPLGAAAIVAGQVAVHFLLYHARIASPMSNIILGSDFLLIVVPSALAWLAHYLLFCRTPRPVMASAAATFLALAGLMIGICSGVSTYGS